MRALVGLSLVVLTCCSAGAEVAATAQGRNVASGDAVRVETAGIARSDATIKLMLPGEIEGSQDAVLASALGGQVERVEVAVGDAVKAGQVLVRIDADIYAAQFAQAEAQAELAADELARIERMGKLASESQLGQLRAQAKVTAAQLAQARSQLARAVIRAPFDGVVANLAVKRGEFAPPGQPVLRVIALDPVKVTLSVSDRDVVALVEGMPALVSTAASSLVVPGVVSHIAPASDLRTRAFPVEVRVANDNRQLLPGMIAQVTVERTVEAGAFVIPQDWLVTQRQDRGVFVVDGEVARWRSLELGQVVQQAVVVTGGLDGSEEVVITGHRELVDGDPLLVARRGQCCTAGRVVFGG